MNATDIEKALNVYNTFGKNLEDFTFAEKCALVKELRSELSIGTRNIIDYEAVSESGEYPSLVTRLMQGDEIFFAQQVERITVDYWIEAIEQHVEVAEVDGDEPEHLEREDTARRAREANEELKRGYAA